MHTLEQLRSGELKGVKEIHLSGGLSDFPREIFELADSLEVLDLSNNNLSSLPDDFGRLSKLKIAFFSKNNFTELPAVLGDCVSLTMIGFRANQIEKIHEKALPPTLEWLILTDNQITSIPASIGRCVGLRKMGLSGNKINSLPDEMVKCRALELLRLGANDFQSFPTWLFQLPRLSWLAFSGNPCVYPILSTTPLDKIAWNDLEIMDQIGEGSSGIISKAKLKTKGGEEVAVKVFKGGVTSDGYPDDELRMCIAAGLHENLVLIMGEVNDHPEGRHALVMELISSEYKNLGEPPTFETCTRDVFSRENRFYIDEIINIGLSVVSALVHLHEKGISHGDIYAHNTMVDTMGNALLGDFGAATPYDKENELGELIERLDVRAFGCLLDDMATRIPEDEDESDLISSLKMIISRCFREDVRQRPSFMEVYQDLKKIKDEIRLKHC